MESFFSIANTSSVVRVTSGPAGGVAAVDPAKLMKVFDKVCTRMGQCPYSSSRHDFDPFVEAVPRVLRATPPDGHGPRAVFSALRARFERTPAIVDAPRWGNNDC